jgi:elongation factor G
MLELAEEYRMNLIEKAADFDDVIMEKYLEGKEVTNEELKAAIRKGCVAVKLIPVVCGTSYRNRGVQKLLDAIVDYLPSPLDVPPIEGLDPDTGETEIRHADDDAPFAALAFKIMTDPFVGRLAFIPSIQGHARAERRYKFRQGSQGEARPRLTDARQPPRGY